MNYSLGSKTKGDARFGNARSSNFRLFDDKSCIIRNLENDLTKIMMAAVQSDIYIFDSFCNILGAGGGSTPHHHSTIWIKILR